MKNILFLITLCLLAFSCKDDNPPREEFPAEVVPKEEIPVYTDYPCPKWIEKEFEYYTENMPSAVPIVYIMEQDDVLYYAIIDGFSPNITATLRLFDAEGTEIGKEHEEYEALKKSFTEGKFQFNYSCSLKNYDDPEELGCDDCPCPEWADKEFEYYADKLRTSIPMLFYMEKAGVAYYAIKDGFSSTLAGGLRLFEADGTEIGEDHEGHEVLRNLFLIREFRFNGPCTIKYLEKY
jgi:hypothetical protein